MPGGAACCPLLGLGGPGLCLLRGCLSQVLSLRFVPPRMRSALPFVTSILPDVFLSCSGMRSTSAEAEGRDLGTPLASDQGPELCSSPPVLEETLQSPVRLSRRRLCIPGT